MADMTRKAQRTTHFASVLFMAVMVLVATGDGFAQSYAGLYHWALEHSLHGWKAESFPLMVDLFILVGEIGLFALALEGHKLSKNWLPWADLALPGGIAAGGWGVSLAFNVGAVGPDLADRLTAAVPPVASMLGLLVLLRTLHRLVGRAAPAKPVVAEAADQVSDVPEIEPVLSHPQTVVAEAAEVAEPVAEEAPGASLVEAILGQPLPLPAENPDPGQGAVVSLDDAVISARTAGMSVRAVSEAFNVTRYRVEKLDKERVAATDSATPGTVNGYAIGFFADN